MIIPPRELRSRTRSSHVWDIVEYFETGKFEKVPEEDRFKLLNNQELMLVASELQRCREDFRYAASNYFWISDKEGNDRLFELWDGQELVLQKLEDMKKRGKPQRICLIKARQLGLSLLGCGIVAWVCMFRSNRRGMIVSEDEDQSQNLFNSYLSPIYRQLPWWLRPKSSSFKLDTGIVLDVPAKDGGLGLNSLIRVQWANRKGGLGQGYRLNAFHGSEFTSWSDLQGTLEEDLKYALVNSPDTIAILESTAKGAGTESHAFYKKCVNLGDKADWEAVFLPYFFEKKRVLAPPSGWRIGEEEKRMRDVVESNWCRCSNKVCGRYFNRKTPTGTLDGTTCQVCDSGTLEPYVLRDDQIYFIVNERVNASNTKSIKQELALTAEEAFIAKGEQVFSEKAIENVEYFTERAPSPLKGFFDRHGYFHGYSDNDLGRKCHLEGCSMFHDGEDLHLWVWEKPITNARYQIGVDVGYGKGKDFSVAWVNRVGTSGSEDVHVATLRTNIVNPLDLSYEIAKLGKWYNEAQIAVEYNTPGNSTADQLLNNLSYPNCYRRKTTTGAPHWLTLQNTKPKLIVTADRWLKEGIFIARDPRFLDEIKVFTSIDGSLRTGAQGGFNDDVVMAAMICLFTAHEGDYEDNYGIVPSKIERTPDTCDYKMSCGKCHKVWGADSPGTIRNCPFCQSMFVLASRNLHVPISKQQDPRNDLRDFDPKPEGDHSSYGEEKDWGVRDYALL